MSDATAPDILIDDTRAKRNVAVLVAAQAILGSQITMIFVVGGLAGLMIAPTPALATLPISLIVFGSMTTAPWLSSVMQRFGRKTGFFVGAIGGAIGSMVAAYGLYIDSFPIFLIGSYFTGIYMSAQGFYRFAAADTASEAFRPKAISYVMAGGLISALIGPQLVKVTTDMTVVPFMGTYAVALLINLVGMAMFLFLDLPTPPKPKPGAAPARSRLDLLRDPRIAVAVICGMVAYALMNLMMTSTPLAVVGCGFTTGNAADIVSAHVIAMFAPSFFTGHLIARFGATRIVAIGLFLLAGAGVIALTGVELYQFFGALILLGVGWNFGFIGATAMLQSAHAPEERGRVQGMNDFMVFGCVTVASLTSGILMTSGVDAEAGWTAVNIAMIPFLTLAGAALIWLSLRPQSEIA
ncbi:MFS transporter [Roseobacter sp. HKCCD9010]|uniref:MFS transporter n=1 Tax=Rhodobacterales TaxID=204455 RepID=UPI0014929DC5|nr:MULTISPECIES: MFS transporter [Rhodobacterales]MBF9050186.1 MFS transporter [Rhodobacterales bacterium HKCCD4356]NNV12429.1 MFS transporter [Roseobacter sp. HKCCD7357]NNV16107.1 MFS transporter [Roseobacter sp. HKCCD8768]NNV25567.1 MFS transporter [Roseobacter sp. HKCCD8192]NNV29823.1 MFS transporter [Roseobacter sp. HKCCD9061]